MNDTATNDIGNAIMHLTTAFRKHGLSYPGRIVLSKPEDGYILKALVRNEPVQLAMDPETGAPLNQIEIAGVLVQWPARRIARHSGGFDFI